MTREPIEEKNCSAIRYQLVENILMINNGTDYFHLCLMFHIVYIDKH